MSPWSKSCCQHKAYSSQIWFQHRFCYCIISLFALNFTYSAPQLVSPLLSGENVHVWRRTWGTGLNLHVLHSWLKQMARVDPSAQPGKMLSSSVIGGRTWAVHIGQLSASLIEACILLSYGNYKDLFSWTRCVLLSMTCFVFYSCKKNGKKYREANRSLVSITWWWASDFVKKKKKEIWTWNQRTSKNGGISYLNC